MGTFKDNSVTVGQHITKFLRDDTENNMAVDGSVTPVRYMWEVPDGWFFYMHRVLISIVDNVAVNADEFGGVSALTNGCRFYLKSPTGDERFDFLDGETIKTNGDFANFAGVDVVRLAGNRGVGVRWTLSKATSGKPIQIPEESTFVWAIRDDLSSLVSFTVALQGTLIGINAE